MDALPRPAAWAPMPPASAPCLTDDRDAHVWLLLLDAAPLPRSEWIGALSEDERARAARLRVAADRRRFETSRGLLRRVLSHYVGAAPDAIRFALGEQGKPHLADAHGGPRVSFSLSRSGPYALVGVTRTWPIGVDIEVRRDVPEQEAIARAHFAMEEQDELSRLPPQRRSDAFLACWTRKEAYVKAVGGGLHTPLDRFVVTVDPEAPARLSSIDGSAEAARAWTLACLRPAADAWAALAMQCRDGRPGTYLMA